MLTKVFKLTLIINRIFHIIVNLTLTALFFSVSTSLFAQKTIHNRAGNVNKVKNNVDTLLKTDSVRSISGVNVLKTDSLVVDTMLTQKPELPIAVGDLNSSVFTDADLIEYDVENEMIHLYGNAHVKYDNIEVKAHEIHFNYANKTFTAVSDTTKNSDKEVLMIESGKEYRANEMVYNYETKKGKINQLVTSDDGEGIVFGNEVKKNEYDELFAEDAYYTTCQHDDPHFHISVNKVKIIPKTAIYSGPANLVIADIPTPLVLPFAFFPLNENRASGIILPTYGESPGLGFYLRQGGFYWAINDYVDLGLLGDIYTNGSWRTNIASQYRLRYRFNGNLNLSLGRTFQEERINPEFSKDTEFRIAWTHRQDAKARPNGTFSTSVNIASSNYQRNFNTISQSALDNTLNSSISYNYNFPRAPFSFSASLRHNSNLNDKTFNLTLPQLNLNMQTLYPFQKKKRVGSKKWYENTQISYSGSFNNRLETFESEIFKLSTYKNFKTDISHSVPISVSFRLFKHFNFSPSITYRENWFFKHLEWEYHPDSIPENSEIKGVFAADTIKGFAATREFGNIGPSLSTNLFGIFNFKKGKIKAIRHVLSPRLSYNFLPDFSTPFWKNYQTITYANQNGVDTTEVLSRFIDDNRPTSSQKQSSISLGLGNRFDMKIRTPKDSLNKEKKIEILRSLNISTGYNFAKESFKMSDISMTAAADFLNKFTINFNASFSPYVFYISENGSVVNVDRYLIKRKVNRKLARFKSATLRVNTRFSDGDFNSTETTNKGTEGDIWELNEYPERFLDFNQKWNLNLSYVLGFGKQYNSLALTDSIAITQNNLNVTFDFNLTDKWKVNGSSGYNFASKELTYTRLNITRDLHCWQMSFNWVPFGNFRSYDFRINVKAAVLQDLKLTRRRQWSDF